MKAQAPPLFFQTPAVGPFVVGVLNGMGQKLQRRATCVGIRKGRSLTCPGFELAHRTVFRRWSGERDPAFVNFQTPRSEPSISPVRTRSWRTH